MTRRPCDQEALDPFKVTALASHTHTHFRGGVPHYPLLEDAAQACAIMQEKWERFPLHFGAVVRSDTMPPKAVHLQAVFQVSYLNIKTLLSDEPPRRNFQFKGSKVSRTLSAPANMESHFEQWILKPVKIFTLKWGNKSKHLVTPGVSENELGLFHVPNG